MDNTKSFNKSFSYVEEKYIRNKEYEKAKKMLKEDGFFNSEAEFLANLKNNHFKTSVFEFIKTFENPSWEKLIDVMESSKIKSYLNFLNKEKIEIDISKNNWSFVKHICSHVYDPEQSTALNEFFSYQQENINRAFLDSQKAQEILKIAVPRFIEKYLTSKEVVNSQAYQAYLLSERYLNSFANSHFTELFDLKSLPANMEEQTKNMIASNHAIAKLNISRYETVQKQEKDFNDLLNNPKFAPDFSLLPQKITDNFKSGNFSALKKGYTYKTNVLSLLKTLIENNFIQIEDLNNYVGENTPFAGRLLKARLNAYESKDNMNNNLDKLYNEFAELKALGIQFNIDENILKDVKDRKNRLEELKKHHDFYGRYDRGDFSKEIYELSRETRIPPHILEPLIDFFDKRYGHKLENVVQEEKVEDIQWNDFLASFKVTKKELQEEVKATLKMKM